MARDKLSLTPDQKALTLIINLLRQMPVADPKHCAHDNDYENIHQQVWDVLQQWKEQTASLALEASRHAAEEDDEEKLKKLASVTVCSSSSTLYNEMSLFSWK